MKVYEKGVCTQIGIFALMYGCSEFMKEFKWRWMVEKRVCAKVKVK